MFKDVRLGIKIGGGFGIVLVFLLVISFISLNGAGSIIASAKRSEIASSIVNNTQSALLSGKNFVITKDKKYADNVYEKMQQNITVANELKPQVKDPENSRRLDDVIQASTDYGENIRKYVDLEVKNDLLVESLTSYALSVQQAQGRLENIPRGQEIGKKITEYFYDARMDVLQFRLYQKSEYAKNAEDSINKLLAYVSNLISDNRNSTLENNLVSIKTNVQQYSDAFLGYEKNLPLQLEAQTNAVTVSAIAITRATEINTVGSALVESTYVRIRLIILIAGLFCIILGVCIALFLTKTISDAMRRGVVFAQKIAQGDLTAETGIKQKDEIGQLAFALDEMMVILKKIVREISGAACQVRSGSQQLSTTSQEMSQGATEQAASVEEISSSMEQMTANIKQNADNSNTTEKIAQRSAQIAEEGGTAVTRTVEAMKQIASKISIIEEIARSTNMLALNASIEAARAGEYGKGFAVVASEVGKLAERSQKEAGEISKLSVESVQIAELAGQTILSMIPEIKRTAELVQEISASSNEQNSGAEQINQAIIQLDQVVQQNASASEESASMSEELASQAEQMQGSIDFFKLEESDMQKIRSVARPQKVSAGETKRSDVSSKSKGLLINLDDVETGKSGNDSLDSDFREF